MNDIRYCDKCKKKTQVVYEEPITERCKECNGNFDIPKEFK
ncbi:MAG: hypothetical protein WC781_05670 [Candidatus Pacearchaeota archaeon]|jgi:hypothetical protein